MINGMRLFRSQRRALRRNIVQNIKKQRLGEMHMPGKKEKHIPATYDVWTELYVKEYTSGPYKNKPDINLLPDEVYKYIKENKVISDTPRYKRREDGKTEED